MSDHGSYPPGQGHAWRGDWLARLLDILRSKGFDSLSAFAQTAPNVTLKELASLIGPGDVAPVQLQWRLVEEARGSRKLRECALDLCVRFLNKVPQGWPSDLSWEGQEDVRGALISWQVCLRDEHFDTLLGKMVNELLATTNIPPGWRPSGTEDPRLVALFNKHWPPGSQEVP